MATLAVLEHETVAVAVVAVEVEVAGAVGFSPDGGGWGDGGGGDSGGSPDSFPRTKWAKWATESETTTPRHWSLDGSVAV